MHLIDISEQAAGELAAKIAEHIPPGESLGRIRVAARQQLVCDGPGVEVIWGLDADNGGAWRYLKLHTGLIELTTWYLGKEESRRIVHDGEVE